MIARMEISPAKQRLLYGFFEKYLKLDEKEEKLLMEEIKQLEDADKILEIPISYEERGIEKGIEKGIRKVALEMLKDGIPKERVAKLTGLEKQELEKMHNDN
jgi:predicted transposase/invertase (TIGR01784 family)